MSLALKSRKFCSFHVEVLVDSVFQVCGVTKVYRMGDVEVHALCGINLELYRGEFVVVLGASGSGKSTLLNILGGLDTPTSGTVLFLDHDLTSADEDERTAFRRDHVGFVFQFYNLIAGLTALENVALVAEIAEHPLDPRQALEIVGLGTRVSHSLYGGDEHYRLCQETILGFGGVRILRALGFDDIRRFHMNEGHAALLTLELLREEHERAERSNISQVDVQAVYDKCVFTTHTPVPSGHDQFSLDLVDKVLGNREACGLNDPICHHGQLNMTFLALSLSRFVNGVAKKHGEVSRHLFADYKIDAITNGVHAATWISPPFTALFDKNIPGWKEDNFSLRAALSISDDDIWYSHQAAKHRLIEYIDHQTNAGLDIDSLTIGVARRAAAYKRVDLIFDDLDRLRRISRDIGRIQLVFAGKAHPRDAEGKRLIQDIIQCGRKSQGDIIVTYLPNYDMALARTLIAGVDVWLNTPEPPLEASGTSGMKAAMNGVPSLSVLDGWWIEGCIEDVTGWAIGSPNLLSDRSRDANSLYDKLENTIIPRFYHDRHRFIEIMRHAIALNGSFFNTQRMLQQYVLKAYFE